MHLATALAERGHKCLIWDLDMNCGATRHFGIPADMPVLGTFEVLKGDEDPLDVVVAHGDIEGIEMPDDVELIPARRNLEASMRSWRPRPNTNSITPRISYGPS